MVHLVYFSPGNLGDPVVRTDAGPAALISCLQSLLQNCLLLDFKDYRFDKEVMSQAEKLPADIKKPVKILLAQFKKRKRIIRAAKDDYSGKEHLALLAAQAERLAVELVILQVADTWDEAPARVPRTSIKTYAMSDFEARRSEEIKVRHLKDDEMSGDEFIDRYLVPFLRFSQQLDIVDGSLGEHYREDYDHTVDRLFAAVRRVCVAGEDLEITVHCRQGRGHKAQYVHDKIHDLARRNSLADRVRVRFYGEFKHDRCLVSEIGVVNIGRGFDFIRKRTGSLRETTVGFGGPDLKGILGPYESART